MRNKTIFLLLFVISSCSNHQDEIEIEIDKMLSFELDLIKAKNEEIFSIYSFENNENKILLEVEKEFQYLENYIDSFIIELEKNNIKNIPLRENAKKTSKYLHGEHLHIKNDNSFSAYDLRRKIDSFKINISKYLNEDDKFIECIFTDQLVLNDIALFWEIYEFYMIPKKLGLVKIEILKQQLLMLKIYTYNHINYQQIVKKDK